MERILRYHNNQKGFTLIELLVVISIIGLLASVILVSLNSARGKSRDTARKQTLRQIQKALELYYDANSSYPSTGFLWYSSEPGDANPNGPSNNGVWIPGIAPSYVATLPRDPLGGNSTISVCGAWKRSYHYISNGTNYKLLAHCSPDGTPAASDTFYDPVRPNHAWMICSGEPACSTW